MQKIFIDTNIIIDLIANRQPFSKYAITIFNKAEKKEVTLYTSSHSIATTHYMLKKYYKEKEIREIIYNLLYYLQIIPVDTDIIKKGLKSIHKDFEDSIQILCASTIHNIDCIVTRNIKDYKNSEIEVLSPEDVVKII